MYHVLLKEINLLIKLYSELKCKAAIEVTAFVSKKNNDVHREGNKAVKVVSCLI